DDVELGVLERRVSRILVAGVAIEHARRGIVHDLDHDLPGVGRERAELAHRPRHVELIRLIEHQPADRVLRTGAAARRQQRTCRKQEVTHQYLASSSEMTRYISAPSFACISRVRNSGSLNSRLMRASALR